MRAVMNAAATVWPVGDYSNAARRLVAQPLEWHRINGFDVDTRAWTFARHIQEGRMGGFDEIGVDVQLEVRGCDVYGRYTGTAQLDDQAVSS